MSKQIRPATQPTLVLQHVPTASTESFAQKLWTPSLACLLLSAIFDDDENSLVLDYKDT
jgi:hypothetical protein